MFEAEGEEVTGKSRHGGPRANSGGARPGAGRKRKPPPPPPAPPDLAHHWYCVRTSCDGERIADIGLRMAGFEVFSPMLWKPSVRARRYPNGTVSPAKPERVVPLFRRYMFVRFSRAEVSWRRIWATPGVDFVFSSTPEMPVPVPDQAITAIRGLPGMAANGCLYPSHHATGRVAPLAVGTSARILNGAMADLEGIVAMSDGKRVRLLMEIMGRPVTVMVEQSTLEAA